MERRFSCIRLDPNYETPRGYRLEVYEAIVRYGGRGGAGNGAINGFESPDTTGWNENSRRRYLMGSFTDMGSDNQLPRAFSVPTPRACPYLV
jgi:hypothetical protein